MPTELPPQEPLDSEFLNPASRLALEFIAHSRAARPVTRPSTCRPAGRTVSPSTILRTVRKCLPPRLDGRRAQPR